VTDEIQPVAEQPKTVPPSVDASIPPAPPPDETDPFADDTKGTFAESAPTPLLERMRLHFQAAQIKETPFGAASHFGDTMIERAARQRGQIAELENENISRAVKARDDLAQYDRMPGAEGFLEYGAAIAGHIAGNLVDPTSAIGNVVKIPYLAARGALGRMAEFGVNQAIVNTTTDPVIQGLNIATGDGARDKYDPFQTFVEAPIGGFLGGALLKGAHEAGTALFIKSPIEKDAFTFLKLLRDNAGEEETKRWPDFVQAVQGKSDAELGVMATELARADKKAAERPATTPQAAADRIAAEAPEGSTTTVEINGETATAGKGAGEPAPASDPVAVRDAVYDRFVEQYGHDATQWPQAAKDEWKASLRGREATGEPAGEVAPAGGSDSGVAAEQGEVASFRTAKGSEYTVNSDGTTTRNKAARPDVGHEGDEGIKPPSDKTVYADVDAAGALAIPQGAKWRIVDHGDGTISLATQNADGRWGIAPSAKNVPVSASPGVGKIPVELWKPSELNGSKAFGEVHFGNPITEVRSRPSAAKPSEAIGDNLAASHSEVEGTLNMAVRPLEASLPRAPEVAQARSNVTTNAVEAPNLRQMWVDLANSVQATVRQGRMVSKKAAGEFGTTSGVIRMKNMDDLTVLAHELGHHVEAKYGAELQQEIQAHGELDFMTGYAAGQTDPATRRSEGFAEFFRLFVENPQEAERRAPNFFDAFTKFLDKKPELKAALTTAQQRFDAYRVAFAEDLVDANIHSSKEPTGWEKLKNDVSNKGFWNTITDRGSMIYTGLFDEKNSLAVAVRSILAIQKNNTGRIISLIAADDPYKLIRLATNAHQAGMIDMMHGVVPHGSVTPEGPSLFDALALAIGKPNILSGWDEAAMNKFSGYLIARRGVFEWERKAAGLLDKDPMPFPKDVYEKKIEVYEAENPNARDAAEMVHQWTRNLLKKEYEAGLITAEAYNNALKIRDYVPLMRDMSEKGGAGVGGGGSTFDAGQVGLKRFGGSSRPIIDPLESLMQRSFRTAQLIAHNDAIKALATLAERAGVGAGAFAERVPAHEIKAKYVDPLDAIRKGLTENGASKEDADLAISTMLDDLQIDKQSIGPVSIFRSEQAAARGENLVFYLDGGDMKALRLTEGDFGRQLVDTLTGGLSTPLRDWNLQAIQRVGQVLRAGVTTSPDFFITNLFRDQIASWVLNRGVFPVVSGARGVWRELTNSELSRIYAQHGGIAGGANLNGLDRARVDADIQALANKGVTVGRFLSFEGYFRAIEMSETGSRLGIFEAAYKRALKQGLSEHQAAIEATFSAVDFLDFGRHGSRMAAASKIVPFLNAGMQGTEKAWRTLISPAFQKNLTTGDVEAKKLMALAWSKIALLTGASMALRAAYIDDPEYQEISDYIRNTHWVVKVPFAKSGKVVDAVGRELEVPANGRHLWLALPKPFELAIIPNLGERGVEMLAQQDPKALSRWAWGALDLVAPKTIVNSTGLNVIDEMRTGKNMFTGRDIVPDSQKGKLAWAQATASTSEFSKAVGKAADRVQRALGREGGGISPMYVDHLVQGVGGSWGRTFLSLSDKAMGDKGDKNLSQTAIAQRVFKDAFRGSTSTQEFWSQVSRENGQLKQLATTYDAMLSNPTEAAAFVARLPPDQKAYVVLNKSDFKADEKRLHPLYRAEEAIKTIGQLTNEIATGQLVSAATRDPIPLSGSERRVAQDTLNRIRMWEARNSLIASGNENLKGMKPGPIEADMEMLKTTVPQVYDELAQRYANAKVYKADLVAEKWPEVRQALIDDGSDAKLDAFAREVKRGGFELDMKREKAKKLRPSIVGLEAH